MLWPCLCCMLSPHPTLVARGECVDRLLVGQAPPPERAIWTRMMGMGGSSSKDNQVPEDGRVSVGLVKTLLSLLPISAQKASVPICPIWFRTMWPLQGMIPGSWDQVLHQAPRREPASPSACVSASLCVSLMNK